MLLNELANMPWQMSVICAVLIFFKNEKFNGTSIAPMSQTLFGNPKGPVELGNPNTCAETKLCLNLFYSGSRSSLAMSLTAYAVDLTKARIGFVEDSSSQQTETTVSNNNKCIKKNHVRLNFYSTLCQTAKRNQHYNLIQSTQIILPL